MPAKFHMLSPSVWDRTQRQLGGPAKVVRYYVQSCPNRISEGLFLLPLGILIHDTGLSEDHARQGLSELKACGFVSYDEDAEVVLDRTALKLAPLRHGRDDKTGEVKRNRAMVNAVRLFDQVPDTPLKSELYLLALDHSPDFAAELLAHDPRLGDPSEPPAAIPHATGIDGGSMGGVELGIRAEPDTSGEKGCKVEGCSEAPVWKDTDGGSLLCPSHGSTAFGEVVPLEAAS